MKKFLCVLLALFTLLLTGCGGKEVYSGEGYEFSYDTAKWELNFVSDNGMAAFKRNNEEVVFTVYRYSTEENVSLAERLESSKEIICEMNGYTWDSGEILDIDGMEWFIEEYQAQIGENKLMFINYFTANGTYAYTISFISDIDSFDKCIKDFEDIFDSFEITE